MHSYKAEIRWHREAAVFTDNRYHRRHEWSFDGGLTVPASASPQLVPAGCADAAAIDPEEAVVAAASSCHMLWFLSLAARIGIVVEGYADDAEGILSTNAQGRTAFSRITLRPRVTFGPGLAPTVDRLAELHHAAHEACYIASSLRCEVVIASD